MNDCGTVKSPLRVENTDPIHLAAAASAHHRRFPLPRSPARNSDYYALLGIKHDATLEEVKQAFFSKSKKVCCCRKQRGREVWRQGEDKAGGLIGSCVFTCLRGAHFTVTCNPRPFPCLPVTRKRMPKEAIFVEPKAIVEKYNLSSSLTCDGDYA